MDQRLWEIRNRIKALEQARETFIRQANVEVAGFTGRIDELKALLAEWEQPEEPKEAKG